MSMQRAELIYVYDPMCVWCYAFTPILKHLREHFQGQLHIKKLLGGLAPDSDVPMETGMQQYIKRNWLRAERVLHERLNFEFWVRCIPMRSTYPACRAVIAARLQGKEDEMTEIIQVAYYHKAMNPSCTETLKVLAECCELDMVKFLHDFESEAVNDSLMEEIEYCRKIEATGFPAIILKIGDNYNPIEVNYRSFKTLAESIEKVLTAELATS